MTHEEALHWLKEEDEDRLEALWLEADQVRRKHVGDAVHLRGLIEVSNHCARQCGYCGLRSENRQLARYRMTEEEVLGCAASAVELGYGTVVMQAGEDYGITRDWLAAVVKRIKRETPLAVTLSMGERPLEDLRAWREAGADRYLLRFETSDDALYRRIHPPLAGGWNGNRIELLKEIKTLGYETGSGVMAGIPGQTFESLANDVMLFQTLDLDMIGIGPFIPHPGTPLGATEENERSVEGEQVYGTELMTCKMVALARLACPEANIPSTTALATINKVNGRELGLMRGANVVMPNLTPIQYRRLYEIYPAKACIDETPRDCAGCLRARIASIGRHVGVGPGGRTGHGDTGKPAGAASNESSLRKHESTQACDS